MPSWNEPRLFIPSDSVAGRWRRSGFYPAYRKTALAYKYALRCRTALLATSRLVNQGTATWHVGQFVQDVLPDTTSISVLLGTEGPAQKTTLQLCDTNDNVLGYVKYGVSEAAKAGIENEQEILSALPEQLGPRLLKYGSLGDGVAIITASINGDPVPATLPPQKSVIEFQDKLFTSDTAPAATHPGLTHINTDTTRAWIATLDNQSWPIAIQHGDFAPWNLKTCDGNVRAFDWEYGSTSGFPYFDVAFFSLQTDVKIYRVQPDEAFTKARKILTEMTPLSPEHAGAIVRLAAFDAHAKGLRDGHAPDTFLQQWYQGVWEAHV